MRTMRSCFFKSLDGALKVGKLGGGGDGVVADVKDGNGAGGVSSDDLAAVLGPDEVVDGLAGGHVDAGHGGVGVGVEVPEAEGAAAVGGGEKGGMDGGPLDVGDIVGGVLEGAERHWLRGDLHVGGLGPYLDGPVDAGGEEEAREVHGASRGVDVDGGDGAKVRAVGGLHALGLGMAEDAAGHAPLR